MFWSLQLCCLRSRLECRVVKMLLGGLWSSGSDYIYGRDLKRKSSDLITLVGVSTDEVLLAALQSELKSVSMLHYSISTV